MLRICMVVFSNFPEDTRVRREAEALVSRGDRVDVISLGKLGKANIKEIQGIKQYHIPAVRYRGSNPFIYIIDYLTFCIAAALLITFLHLKKPYHIVQVHTMPDFLVFVAAIPKLLGAKVVLDVHDLMPELYVSKFGKNKNQWLVDLLTWIERASIRFAHKAIAVHKTHLEALVSHGNPENKFILLMNLPDQTILSHKVRKKSQSGTDFKLVYHGMIAHRHGLQIAIQALSHAVKEIPNLKLEIYGDGDGLQELVNLVARLDLSSCVYFSKGFVPMEKLIPIIQEADVGIVPILYDAFTKYMLPVKLLEYVGLGIPAICSRTETIEAYFDDSMLRFSTPGDFEELAENICDLYHHSELRDSLIQNSERFNRIYNWQQQKLSYYNMLDALTTSTPKGANLE